MDPVIPDRGAVGRPAEWYEHLWLAVVADACRTLLLPEPGPDASELEAARYLRRCAIDAHFLLQYGVGIAKELDALGFRISPSAIRRAGLALACIALRWWEALYGDGDQP